MQLYCKCMYIYYLFCILHTNYVYWYGYVVCKNLQSHLIRMNSMHYKRRRRGGEGFKGVPVERVFLLETGQ